MAYTSQMVREKGKDKKLVFFPESKEVSNWQFENSDEADLADSLWKIANVNGVSVTHFHHVFTSVLRMVGETESPWSKI